LEIYQKKKNEENQRQLDSADRMMVCLSEKDEHPKLAIDLW
jgi:hypothetical protein